MWELPLGEMVSPETRTCTECIVGLQEGPSGQKTSGEQCQNMCELMLCVGQQRGHNYTQQKYSFLITLR